MQDDENYFHSFLDQNPLMKRMPQNHQAQHYRSPFDVLLGQNQYEKPPVLQEIPAPKKKSPKRLRGTSAGAAKRTLKPKKKGRVAPAAELAPQKDQEQHLDVPQPMRTEEIAVPSRVEKRRSPNRMRASRKIPILGAVEEEESPSPAEVARQMHHHEPAFSLRKIAEDQQQEHHTPEHDVMQDATQESENLMEESHAPSAADRLRTIMADQTAVEEEHEKHHDTLTEKLPASEPEHTPQDHLSASEEEEDSMEDETETEQQASPALQHGMTLDDIQTLSKIRELNKQAQSVKIPKLSDVTKLRDLLTPEELLTQTLLNLDNLTVSEFSRPFRKQVIQFIQQQHAKIDSLKKAFRSQNPDAPF